LTKYYKSLNYTWPNKKQNWKAMKKFLIIVFWLIICISAWSQNNFNICITEIVNGQNFQFCENEYDEIVISKDTTCNGFVSWNVLVFPSGDEYYYETNEITVNSAIGNELEIRYYDGCNIPIRIFAIHFHGFQPNEPWSQEFIWKRYGETISLEAPYGDDLEYQWSTGSHQQSINLTEPGVYWIRVYNDCGELTDTIQVRDNVEISLATCDLESNLNMVTWPTTVAQAEYVDHLNVKRDGITVATANYSDGFFLDNIGSDAAPRTYSLVAVGTDGTECPIESYPKETIHMSYLLGVGNTVEVGWNQPSGYDLLGYNICEWNPNSKDGDLTVIDFVGAGVTSYTCQASQFDNGNIVVQGVEAGKTENRLLSNRSWEILNVGEQPVQNFKIYPNPSNGTFTVEGVSTLTIYSMLGQIIATSQSENGVHTFTLAPGIYFIKSDEGTSKKVVVQ